MLAQDYAAFLHGNKSRRGVLGLLKEHAFPGSLHDLAKGEGTMSTFGIELCDWCDGFQNYLAKKQPSRTN